MANRSHGSAYFGLKLLLIVLFTASAKSDICRSLDRLLFEIGAYSLSDASDQAVAREDVPVAEYQSQAMQIYAALQLTSPSSYLSPKLTILQASLSQLALDKMDIYWLGVSGEFGNSTAYYALAMQSDNQIQQKTLLAKAAELNHPQAQFELAILQADADARLDLLVDAGEQGYAPALIALGKHYFEAGILPEAQRWLLLAAPLDALSAFKLARINWLNGDITGASKAFESSLKQGYLPAKGYINVLKRFKKTNLYDWISAESIHSLDDDMCLQRIAMLATSLSSMVQASDFYQRFYSDQRLKSLPICLQMPTWISEHELECSAKSNENGRLSCNLLPIAEITSISDFTHLVIFAEEGKANVDNGVMYLDRADVYSVFVHELAHFAGFVDEYALGRELANYHCSQNQAPNLLLLGDIAYKPFARANTWQQIIRDSKIGIESDKRVEIGRSKTCTNAGLKSYKPSNRMTFLEFHDVGYIPQVYLALWQNALERHKASRAVNTNLANAAWKAGRGELAEFWNTQNSDR